MIKAIFFDIDGTLQTLSLNNETIIPDSTKKALRELKNKGIKIFIASGRPSEYSREIKQKFQLEFDGYIMTNGQYCFTEDTVVLEKIIPTNELEQAIDFLKEKKIACTIVEKDYVYKVQEIDDPRSLDYPHIDTCQRIYEHPVYQIMPLIHASDIEIEKRFFELLPSCKSQRWIDFFMDVVSKDGGKNVGIDAMLKHYGISINETMAFGDGGNDISMLQHVSIGVAMGNAKDDVKEKSDYVTDPILEDGLYNALVHFNVL